MKGSQRPVRRKDRQLNNTRLRIFQRAVHKQGLLALATILLMVVLLFAMTTAWYSNVAQTSGLVFQTASWGFTGDITVGESAIAASPGTSGVIPLTVRNDSDQDVSVVVTVSKSAMSTELRKRLFLYVDTSLKKNGEMMQKVYLTNTSGYTYLLDSLEEMTISEEAYENVPICWEWVYDMLGYYVQGKPTANGTSIVVESYLRPIEYDYDAATFADDDEGGGLLTVDGTTTVAEFLTALSATDGYEGTIDTDPAHTIGGYYPVSVDEEGNGVWAYLCTFSEIERGITYDTQLASKEEEERSFRVTLNFTAQNLASKVVTVETAEALQEALTDTSIDTITLGTNLELTDPLTVPAEASAVLDLNGYTIYSAEKTLFTVYSNASLRLYNGTLQGASAEGQDAIHAIGATVNLRSVTIDQVETGLGIMDYLVDGDSCVTIKDSTVNATKYGVLIQGNGASSAKSQLIVKNSTITGGEIGIGGVSGYGGTDIQVIAGTVKGTWAGIYQPQAESKLSVAKGSDVEGETGLVILSGEVTVTDSTIRGTGTSKEPGTTEVVSTGDGIYVEANASETARVVIQGTSTVSSTHRLAVELNTTESSGEGSIEIYSGTFSPRVTKYWVSGN